MEVTLELGDRKLTAGWSGFACSGGSDGGSRLEWLCPTAHKRTVLQRELAWYCMRGLRPTSPSTITQARGMAAGCLDQTQGNSRAAAAAAAGRRQAAERDRLAGPASVQNAAC